ncbi:hypothetical protein SPRG_14919 [Saprolegnia parasitica CBS 223.65]|uniref:DNA ligase 1 n=1 Tax=Saprolegnia parasitica (strain CBS 223.65) TaxID=695850 RepID=A0A067BKS7_SAPPC|nr:hypothetical protein SPRG_14919 [Saprolegnia parasitica CBS 223.65]KDO18783.1 hypothetical protein SPRG_14919 [Saprolegnia parasitica CBS 223.65]|eukprot:XP_012210505.1 hypothetical protein SPRG_14919 [Saprolegnia parasitica CBS 223.65]
MQFRDLAAVFRRIEAKNSRDASIAELAATFRELRASHPAQLPRALYLATSQLAPTHAGVELRFRDKSFAPVLTAAFASPTKALSQDDVFALYKQTGDYGTAVDELLASARFDLHKDSARAPMTINSVFEQLTLLSTQVGKGSTARKQEIATALLRQCGTRDEATFLVRLLAHQNLRIGVGVKTALAALADAYVAIGDDAKDDRKATTKAWLTSVVTAYSQRPSFDDLVAIIDGCATSASLDDMCDCVRTHASPVPGTPLQTMLGYPAASLAEIVERMAKLPNAMAACEFKYDGARLQVHMTANGDVAIFSRNMERIPIEHKYMRTLRHSLHMAPGVSSLILEGEMVAIDCSTGKLQPFQTLQTKDAEDMCFFAFDCLYHNGTSLVQAPLEDRRARLHQSIVPQPGSVEFVKAFDVDVTTPSAISDVRRVLQGAIDADCEGLMVKSLGESYKAGARTHTWLKVKGDYLSGDDAGGGSAGIFLPDSLDLVPIAAYHGKGRRANVYGSFLLACFDPSSGTYETVGKVGSGFTDAQLTEISDRLQPTTLVGKPTAYRASTLKSVQPDVWIPPTEVWEIRAAQLTQSSRYLAGAREGTKGLGVRFPRFLRPRPDKRPENATTSDQLVELYEASVSSSRAEQDESLA